MITRLALPTLRPLSTVLTTLAPFEQVTSTPFTSLAEASHQPAAATTLWPAGHLMHRGLVVTGLAGVEEQPRPGASKLRVPSILVEYPREVMAALAEPVQVAVMATELLQVALP
jgi:hypothetical protein